MKEFIETYSFQEMIIFLIAFSVAIKGFVSFWDWGYDRLKRVFKKEDDKNNEMNLIQNQIEEQKKEYDILKNSQIQVQGALSDLANKINVLVDSDKDDIKSFIVREHHYFCYQKEWIDDFSLNCIENRFKHYITEGGNSFIEDLMNEIRRLPKHPPSE